MVGAVGGFWSWLKRAAGPLVNDPEFVLSPDDAVELEDAAFRIASEYAVSAPEVIAVTVRQLVRRRVPIRAIRGTAASPGIAELCFADGTILLVRGEHSGDLGKVAIWLIHGGIAIDGLRFEPRRILLELVVAERRASVVALGVLPAR